MSDIIVIVEWYNEHFIGVNQFVDKNLVIIFVLNIIYKYIGYIGYTQNLQKGYTTVLYFYLKYSMEYKNMTVVSVFYATFKINTSIGPNYLATALRHQPGLFVLWSISQSM